MPDSVLYIIGNGFDLYHGVKSSYGSFRKWLQTHDYDTFQTYETVCDYDALWSDFETGMAYVSRDFFLESGLAFFPDSKSDPDEWSAADILLGGDAASSSVYELLDKLKKDFHKWVCSLSVPRDYKDKMLYVDDYARFLTFNYTTFLESHYGIPSSQINHIHGVKTQSWGSLVVGHGEDTSEIFDSWWKSKGYDKPRYNKKGKKYYKRDAIYRMYRGNTQYLPENEALTSAVESYYSDSEKPVDKILRDNQVYFESLSNIEIIYVWGISFSKVDKPYIKKIIEVNADKANLQWYVSAYSDTDHDRALDCLISFGIPESNIHFKSMAEFLKSSSFH